MHFLHANKNLEHEKAQGVFWEQSAYMDNLDYPGWLKDLVPWGRTHSSEQCMSVALSLAWNSIKHNGGPFAAVIADEHGIIHGAGTNSVVASCDSTAHAEILAIRRVQQKFGVFSLAEKTASPLILYSTGEPCIMCFGAIWWSGLSKVYWSARKEDAEAVGFSEGPISPALWEKLLQEKGIEYFPGFCRGEDTVKLFENFRATGVLY